MRKLILDVVLMRPLLYIVQESSRVSNTASSWSIHAQEDTQPLVFALLIASAQPYYPFVLGVASSRAV